MKDVIDLSELRNRVHVFRDRAHAGQILADMIKSLCGYHPSLAATLNAFYYMLLCTDLFIEQYTVSTPPVVVFRHRETIH